MLRKPQRRLLTAKTIWLILRLTLKPSPSLGGDVIALVANKDNRRFAKTRLSSPQPWMV
jgi:hypothetical protein